MPGQDVFDLIEHLGHGLLYFAVDALLAASDCTLHAMRFLTKDSRGPHELWNVEVFLHLHLSSSQARQQNDDRASSEEVLLLLVHATH